MSRKHDDPAGPDADAPVDHIPGFDTSGVPRDPNAPDPADDRLSAADPDAGPQAPEADEAPTRIVGFKPDGTPTREPIDPGDLVEAPVEQPPV